MWANAQHDGRPAEYRWRPLFNTTKLGWCPVLECRAVTLPRRKTRWNVMCWGAPNSPTDLSRYWLKFTILWKHVGETLLFNKFFPIVDTCLRCEDIARRSHAMLPRWRIFCNFLGPFPASRMQQFSDLHPKFALGPHHVWKYSRHPISDSWD